MEKWKTIEGYTDYQVSNIGRVKSLKYGKERILKQNKINNGYLYVHLHKEGKVKNMLIHRLVAGSFLNNQYNLPEVNHRNEDKSDNRIENLEYCDRKYNCNYGTRNERIAKKVKCIDTGVVYPSLNEVKHQLGFSQCNISQCCNGKLKYAYGCRWEYV